MTNRKNNVLKLLICLLLVVTLAFSTLLPTSVFAAASKPYYITNAFGQDAANELIVQWHNDVGVTSQELQLTLAGDTAFANAKKYTPTFELFSNVNANDNSGEFKKRGEITPRNVWKVTVSDLLPDTKYIYRVGTSGAWSETYEHLTSGNGSSFSFTVCSDPQSDAHEAMVNTLSVAQKFDLDNRFFLNCGDVCNEIALNPNEIISYTNAASVFNLKTPIMATQGNHDTYTTEGNNVYRFGNAYIFNRYLAFPNNGCDQNPDHSQSYYFYYNNVLVIMLNTLVTDNQQTVQAQWLSRILEHDKQNALSQYIVVGMHTGPFGNRSVDSWKEPVIRRAYCKIFSDYDVDVVYYGHDHTYTRTNAIKVGNDTNINNINYNQVENGTIYSIVGATGPKFYESTVSGPEKYFQQYQTKTFGEVQDGIFVNVKVTSEKMHCTAIRVNSKGEIAQVLEEYDIPSKRSGASDTPDAEVSYVDANRVSIDLGGDENSYSDVTKIEVLNSLGEVIATPASVTDIQVENLRPNSTYKIDVVLSRTGGKQDRYSFDVNTSGFLGYENGSISINAPFDAKRFRIYRNGDLVAEQAATVKNYSIGTLDTGKYLFKVEFLDSSNKTIGFDYVYMTL